MSPKGWRLLAMVATCIVAVWFALPAFTMSYTEGFQTQMGLNAHALLAGNVALGDIVYPFNGRFFLLTRLGTTLGLAGLHHVTGADALTIFRYVGVISMVLLIGILLVFLLYAYRVTPVVALICCVLFPTVFESAYLPNDDLPSAVLVCLAVLVFWKKPTLVRTALTGLLLGLAALLRLDAVLIAPAFAILLVTEIQGWGARALRAVIAGAIVAGTPILVYHLAGLSFAETFSAINHALLVWSRPSQQLFNDIRTLILSVPAIGGIAWVLGVIWYARAKRWRDLILATLVPLIYAGAYRNQLVEGRYLLPLAPFVLPAMAMGLQSLTSAPGRLRTWSIAGIAVGGLIWIVPLPSVIRLVGDDDGPRFVIGRAWNPLAVLWWQHDLNVAQAAVEHELDKVAVLSDPVVVTTGWTADRLTTLSLLQRGFTLQPALIPAACRGIAEMLVRGQTNLLHIRVHIPFFAHTNENVVWAEVGLPCLNAARPQVRQVVVVRSGTYASLAATSPSSAGPANLQLPPLATRLESVLSGVTVSNLAVGDVAGTMAQPETVQARELALHVLENREALLQ